MDYRDSPVNGVKALSELLEGMIKKAGQDAVNKGKISSAASQAPAATLLDDLHREFPSARAAIGGARKYLNECRNPVHHWPTSKKASYLKYADCRHHFLEGLRTLQTFRKSMKNAGLSGILARI